MKPKITLTFEADLDQKFSVCMDLDEITARDIEKVDPPMDIPGVGSFEEGVRIIRAREFRKEFFVRACKNLGSLLAERMEDAEGWHDISRIEPAKKALRGGSYASE